MSPFDRAHKLLLGPWAQAPSKKINRWVVSHKSPRPKLDENFNQQFRKQASRGPSTRPDRASCFTFIVVYYVQSLLLLLLLLLVVVFRRGIPAVMQSARYDGCDGDGMLNTIASIRHSRL